MRRALRRRGFGNETSRSAPLSPLQLARSPREFPLLGDGEANGFVSNNSTELFSNIALARFRVSMTIVSLLRHV